MFYFKHTVLFRRLGLKYPAFSIVETITALLIIAISFSAGMLIYTQVMDADKLYAKTNTSFTLNQMMAKTKLDRNFVDEIVQIEGMKIVKKVEPYADYKKVYTVTIAAYDPVSETPLLEIKELISTDK